MNETRAVRTSRSPFAGGTPSTGMLTAVDGLALHLRRWPSATARGTVLLVHGLGEHGGRHGRTAVVLNDGGWNVVAHDHRGHGRSGGARGRIDRDDALLADLALVIDAVRAQHAGPLVLLGHSMGGLIASRFVAEALRPQPSVWSREVDALVLSSPALAADLPALRKLMLAALGRLAPDVEMGNGLKPEWVSRDAAVVDAYVADPWVHDRITPRLARFILDGGELVRLLAPRWRVPTLLMWAGADRCVAPRGSAAFAAAAPPDVVQATCFDGFAHELLNEPEPEREQVIACLTDWLRRYA
jgi:alpha-beta hydrolase superfamily lysophospholipase